MPDLVLVNAGELVICPRKSDRQDPLGIVERGAIVVDGGKVTWVGTTKEFKRKTIGKPKRLVDAEGMLVTPGFVDPHTHLVFAGSREDELDRKIAGESYKSILASGGGIARTIRETRESPLARIVAESEDRLSQLLRNGVTTLEVKTGYGQNLETELKLLEAIEVLARSGDAELVPTFLGLHATPPEFKTSREYADYAIREMLPAVARMKRRPVFSDCFCETGVFSREECSRYLRASERLGFALKIHADEFSDSGGASLAAETGCVSADHLGNCNSSGFEELAQAGVTTVLLPGTSLFSGIPYADARGALKAGCSVALGTDLSPNSWVESPQLVMSLACSAMKMTPAQAIRGFTVEAARALGRNDVGTLERGCAADLILHSVRDYRFLPQRVGGAYVRKVFKGGREVYSSTAG